MTVVDTTEVRWFADGSLPADIRSWFTRNGAAGAVEDRCDTYRLGGSPTVGIKLRFGETLELKVLQSVGGYVRLGTDLAGRFEVWRKWSPASRLVDSVDGARWVDVSKNVTKRRFSHTGDELAFEPTTAMGAGCDVEAVSVEVEGLSAWTFAFAAFGPASGRIASVMAAWDALTSTPGLPENFGRSLAVSAGYPSWLTSDVSRRAPASSRA